MLSFGIVAPRAGGRSSGPTRHNDPVIATEPLSSDDGCPPGCPSSAVDLWSEAVLADPYPAFAGLRAAGPVVWLERYGLAALPRFEQVHAVLADWRRFSSAEGVGVGPEGNSFPDHILNTDPPLHDEFRKPLHDQLSAAALAAAVPEVMATAASFAEAVARAGSFDAVADLARPYSLTVVGDLLGLPEQGRAEYPPLAERAFNVFGPSGPRTADGFVAAAELLQRAAAGGEPGALLPGRNGEELWRLGTGLSVVSYTWPGIDTTVNALASAVVLFARHPDQWAALRTDRSLIPAAFNEVLRLHAPVHFFTRVLTEDTAIAGVCLPAGTRVLLMYGSANRDERRFPDADRFDVRRNPTAQLAFGRGPHLCVGINLARLEAHALFAALADRIGRFELMAEPEWSINHTLHGLASAPVRAIPAASG
jgi:cytochrome P450